MRLGMTLKESRIRAQAISESKKLTSRPQGGVLTSDRRRLERAEMLIHVVAKRPIVRFGLTSARTSAKMR
jgi:hypothetical protein